MKRLKEFLSEAINEEGNLFNFLSAVLHNPGYYSVKEWKERYKEIHKKDYDGVIDMAVKEKLLKITKNDSIYLSPKGKDVFNKNYSEITRFSKDGKSLLGQ